MKDLTGKIAFVTGAASGIGLGIATALAQAGVKVMLCDIEEAALDSAVKVLKRTNADVASVRADVSLKAELQAAAEETRARYGGAIRKLAGGGALQLDLFDERNLITFTHDDFPGERLVACRNPDLARLRAAKRNDLIAATATELDKVAAMVMGGRLQGRDKIGVRLGKVLDKYKVGKQFDFRIGDGSLTFSVNAERVAAEAALDGLYVIRTSVAEADMSAQAAVLNYKRLAEIERGFRTLKGVDLSVRPIRHRLEDRVKAHILLSMLAYYVQWHMIEAWAPLTFKDEVEADAARERDPVAPAKRSDAALAKVHTRQLADGTPAISFTRLLAHMATIVRNTMRSASARIGEATFTLTTRPNPKQRQALDRLAAIAV